MPSDESRLTDLTFLLHCNPAFEGGVARVVLNLASQCAAEGLSVDLVVTCAARQRPADLHRDVRIVPLGASGLRDSFLPLVRYMRERRPRGMVSAMEHPNILAVWARRLARVPTRLVVTTHGSIRDRLEGMWGWRERLLLPFLIARSYPRADGIVGVSAGVASSLREIVPSAASKIVHIYNGVVSDRTEAMIQGACETSVFQDFSGPIVLGAGRLTALKDFPTLLHAFAIAQRDRDMRLVLLGDGECRPALVELASSLGIRDKVALPGWVSNPLPYMRDASVFVLSSLWEGLPTVLIEAMACGTPVVSTDCRTGPAEILENGRYGRLVPVGDVNAMAEAILGTLDDPIEPGMLVARAQEFSVEACAQRYRALLEL